MDNRANENFEDNDYDIVRLENKTQERAEQSQAANGFVRSAYQIPSLIKKLYKNLTQGQFEMLRKKKSFLNMQLKVCTNCYFECHNPNPANKNNYQTKYKFEFSIKKVRKAKQPDPLKEAYNREVKIIDKAIRNKQTLFD